MRVNDVTFVSMYSEAVEHASAQCLKEGTATPSFFFPTVIVKSALATYSFQAELII